MTMEESFLTGEGLSGVPRIVSTISTLLQRVTDQNDTLASSRRQLPPSPPPPRYAVAFYALEKPEITIRCYLDRIFQFAHCSPSCYVVAYIYLDRFLNFHPSIAIDSFSVHRFLITAVLTSVKFMEDRLCNFNHHTRNLQWVLTEIFRNSYNEMLQQCIFCKGGRDQSG